MSFTSYNVDNDKAFQNAISEAQSLVSNLTLPLTLISKDFYKSEKAIFMLKSPGQYDDLKPKTKNVKRRDFGFVYPILKRTGRLEESVTRSTHKDSINEIVNKRSLFIGTKTPYAVYHQSDRARGKIPLRKFLFIGPESTFATSEQKGRLNRWLGILESYVVQKMNQKVGS